MRQPRCDLPDPSRNPGETMRQLRCDLPNPAGTLVTIRQWDNCADSRIVSLSHQSSAWRSPARLSHCLIVLPGLGLAIPGSVVSLSHCLTRARPGVPADHISVVPFSQLGRGAFERRCFFLWAPRNHVVDATTRSDTTCSRRWGQTTDLSAWLVASASNSSPWTIEPSRAVLPQHHRPQPAEPTVRREPAAHWERPVGLHLDEGGCVEARADCAGQPNQTREDG